MLPTHRSDRLRDLLRRPATRHPIRVETPVDLAASSLSIGWEGAIERVEHGRKV
jgi:hypothetical protein